ncbi:hypothetical protein D3C87_1076750 [compost metagenome]
MIALAAASGSPAPVSTAAPIGGSIGWIIPVFVILALLKGAEAVLGKDKKRRGGRSRRSTSREGRATGENATRQALERTFEKSPSIPSEDFPYRLDAKSYFFSRAEGAFYPKLVEAATDLELLVFPKVGLCDIFVDKKGVEPGQRLRYAQKHVDYLLVRRRDFMPVAGIELNGPSHQEESQQANDRTKKAVFSAAGLPLLTFYNQPSYSAREIQTRLQDILGPVSP